jgi:hypothetical protein
LNQSAGSPIAISSFHHLNILGIPHICFTSKRSKDKHNLNHKSAPYLHVTG